MKVFNKVAIIGVGLIGGSIGLALKKKRLAKKIIGVARKSKTFKDALRLKAIDQATRDISKAVKGADLVILCQPVEAIIASLPKIAKLLKPGTIVIDVGSSKSEIVKKAQKHLPRNVFFVGCHPLAGSEKKGIGFASSKLFDKTLCILTPTPATNKKALKAVENLWHKLGAKTCFLKPIVHDDILAFISHLPHVVAFSLINSIPAQYLKFSAAGLKDTTRIAASDPIIWKDVCISNAPQILKSLDCFESVLRKLKHQISKRDSPGLKKAFSQAQKKRLSLNVS